MVVPKLNGGGAAQCVIDLTNGLVQAGAEPTVLCLEQMGYLADRICSPDVKVIGPLKRMGNDPLAPFRLARLFHEHHFDLVHGHNWGALVDTVLAAKLARIRAVVHTQHGLDYGFSDAPDHLRSRLRTATKTFACRGVSRIATVSREVARMVTGEWRVPDDKVAVVHNGVRLPARADGPQARARGRREFEIAETDVLVGTVGIFRPVKDLHTLLEAMALVVRARPRARLVMMGEGPQKGELRTAIERLGLASVVRLPGWRRDATELLPALDLFVLSSLSEGISLALLDAMAAGVPVVATRVGGNVEIIEPESGVLVPPRSPRELADAMLALIADPARRRALGAGGRERVEAEFSLKQMVGNYEALYAGLVRADRTGGPDASVGGRRRARAA
jgi:sugar transferase (PEP-CTERM/EpsH1 system associated)